MLHGEKRPAVVFADLMHRDDIRMIQFGRRLCFTREPGFRGLVVAQSIGQKLQRYPPLEGRILGQVHFAHTADADILDNLVVLYFGACNEGDERLGPVII